MSRITRDHRRSEHAKLSGMAAASASFPVIRKNGGFWRVTIGPGGEWRLRWHWFSPEPPVLQAPPRAYEVVEVPPDGLIARVLWALGLRNGRHVVAIRVPR